MLRVGNKKTADSKTLLNGETKCSFVSSFSTHLKMEYNDKCQRTEENKQKNPFVCVRASFSFYHFVEAKTRMFDVFILNELNKYI